MFEIILVAVDGSSLASKARDHGIQLARKLDTRLVFVTVTDMWSALAMAHAASAGQRRPAEEYEAMVAERAGKLLNECADKARSMGIDCRTVHVRDEHVADGIVKTARQYDCDLIIMGSHGRTGLERALLGSHARKVLSLTDVSTLIIR